jgi:hypothetical protein
MIRRDYAVFNQTFCLCFLCFHTHSGFECEKKEFFSCVTFPRSCFGVDVTWGGGSIAEVKREYWLCTSLDSAAAFVPGLPVNFRQFSGPGSPLLPLGAAEWAGEHRGKGASVTPVTVLAYTKSDCMSRDIVS